MLALTGCGPPDRTAPGPGGSDTAAAPCATGELWDGTACVPEACGAAPWGGGPPSPGWFVAPGSDGDGTATAPMGSVQDAVDAAAAAGGGEVRLAAGVHAGPVVFGPEHDGVRLVGRCRTLVVLDGDRASSYPALGMEAAGARVEVSALTITGGGDGGVGAVGGRLVLTDVTIEGATEWGLWAAGSRATVELQDVDLIATERTTRGELGWGMELSDGATVTGERVTVQDMHDVGVVLFGASLELVDSRIAGTAPGPDGTLGFGLEGYDGSDVQLTAVELDGNTQEGVQVGDVGTTLDAVGLWVRGTRPDDHGEAGPAVAVGNGAEATLTELVVEDNTGGALFVTGEGASVLLVGGHLGRNGTGTTTPWPTIQVAEGGALSAQDLEIEDAAQGAATARGAGSTFTWAGGWLRGVDDIPGQVAGWGVSAEGGASVALTDVELFDTAGDALSAFDPETTLVATRVRMGGLGAGSMTDEPSVPVGVYAADGATATAVDLELVDGRGIGASAWAGRVVLEGGSIEGLGPGADGLNGWGLLANGGGAIHAEELRIEGATELGALAYAAGSTLELVDVDVSEVRAAPHTRFPVGLAVEFDASARVEGGRVHGFDGVGVYVAAEASIDVAGAEVDGVDVAGLVVVAATATWTGGRLDPGDTGVVGAYVASIEHLTTAVRLDGVTIPSGAWGGVWIDGETHGAGDAAIELLDVDASGGPGVDLGGGLLVNGNALYAAGDLLAWDGTRGLRIDGGRFHGSDQAAVLLDGASARFEGSPSLEGGEWDLVQQRCATGAAVNPPDDAHARICDDGYDLLAGQLDLVVQLLDAPPTE